jgi:hypothetical protein
MKWSTPLVLIMNSNVEHLGAVDPLTKLCLSTLAAAEPACDLKTINYLISKYPKNADISASDSDKGQGKSKKTKVESLICFPAVAFHILYNPIVS